MFKLKNKKGMTLIEVVVVVAVIGIMAAVSIVSLSKARNQASVEGEAEKVMSVIREAQNYALTGKEAENSGCADYTFSIKTDGTYSLKNGAGCSLDYSFELGEGVSLVSNGDIIFSAPHADVSSPMSITLKKGNYSCTIEVTNVGLVTKTCL